MIDSNALILLRAGRSAENGDTDAPVAARERAQSTGSGRCHSGQRPRLVDEVSPHGTELRVVLAMLNRSRRFYPGLRERRRNIHRQHVFPIEADINGLEFVERPKKEDGAGQQHGGQHHLHD